MVEGSFDRWKRMPRAAYGGTARRVQVYIIERGNRGVGEDGSRCLPLGRGLRSIAETQFDPGAELHVNSTFAVVAALYIGAQGRRGGAENPGLLEDWASELAVFRRDRERQAGQLQVFGQRQPGEDLTVRADSHRFGATANDCRGSRYLQMRFDPLFAQPEPVASQHQNKQQAKHEQPAPHSSQPSGQRTSPRSCTSGSSSTPKLSWTRRRPAAISSKTSAVVASPAFSTKLACFAEKRAPPTLRPRQPAASSSCPAVRPAARSSSGFLKVEPKVLIPEGCASWRRSRIAAIVALIAVGSPRSSRNEAAATTSSEPRLELR